MDMSPWNDRTQLLICLSVITEAPAVKTFTFETAERSWFRYAPGQFITFELPEAGPNLLRSYTLSSTPSRPFTLSVTVKAQTESIGSRWMLDHLTPGMRLKAYGPVGSFTLHHHPAEKFLFISAGSGITPMMSMTRWLHDQSRAADIAFIHAARSPRDLIFRDEIEWLAGRMQPFRLAWIVEDPSSHFWPGFRGRLTHTLLPEISSDFHEREIFCCGPEPFMASVRGILGDAGFDMRHYHEESFHPAASIQAPDLPSPEIADGSSRLVFTQSGIEHDCLPGETVLLAARSIGINIPNACQSGLCGTCKIRCLEGQVDMQHNGGILEEEIAEGYILACCTRPLGRVAIEA